MISYEADVTWNENTYLTKRDNLANLLFNVIVLCGILYSLALVVGVGFGGDSNSENVFFRAGFLTGLRGRKSSLCTWTRRRREHLAAVSGSIESR